jgi:hypothetical protein
MQESILELERQNEQLMDSIAAVREKKSVFTKNFEWSYVN